MATGKCQTVLGIVDEGGGGGGVLRAFFVLVEVFEECRVFWWGTTLLEGAIDLVGVFLAVGCVELLVLTCERRCFVVSHWFGGCCLFLPFFYCCFFFFFYGVGCGD